MELIDEELEESPLLSVQLPYLVVQELLENLDLFSLKNLRLVSRLTKSWVETPEHLRHFQVRIPDKDRLDEVLCTPDPVPWNSFLFTEEYKYITSVDVWRFRIYCGKLARHLELHWSSENAQQILCLLSGCPNLESLEMDELNISQISDRLANKLLQNWRNMRNFHVELFRHTPDVTRPEMTFFSRVLYNCSHLKHVTVPEFIKLYNFVEPADSYQRLVINPLQKTITQRRLRSVRVPDDKLDDQYLLQIALACRKTNSVLYHESNSFLNSLPIEHLAVMEIIGTLDLATDNIFLQSLRNVRNICLNSCTYRMDNRAYVMPFFPNLRHLDLDCHCSFNNSVDRFANRLATQERPTVEYLSISFPNYVSPVDLCTSFVNLRDLSVEFWEGQDREWLNLWPLVAHNLVKLQVANCSYLTDRGILGNDPSTPAILQLKRLRQLSLTNEHVEPGESKITEKSLAIIRTMGLKSFIFTEGRQSAVRRPPDIVEQPLPEPDNEAPVMDVGEESKSNTRNKACCIIT